MWLHKSCPAKYWTVPSLHPGLQRMYGLQQHRRSHTRTLDGQRRVDVFPFRSQYRRSRMDVLIILLCVLLGIFFQCAGAIIIFSESVPEAKRSGRQVTIIFRALFCHSVNGYANITILCVVMGIIVVEANKAHRWAVFCRCFKFFIPPTMGINLLSFLDNSAGIAIVNRRRR